MKIHEFHEFKLTRKIHVVIYVRDRQHTDHETITHAEILMTYAMTPQAIRERARLVSLIPELDARMSQALLSAEGGHSDWPDPADGHREFICALRAKNRNTSDILAIDGVAAGMGGWFPDETYPEMLARVSQ